LNELHTKNSDSDLVNTTIPGQSRTRRGRKQAAFGSVLAVALLGLVPFGAATAAPPTPAAPRMVASTVPANGDQNPYGVAVVPQSSGRLVQGDVLVSNFNNKKNQPGMGTTILQIAPNGTSTLFAQIDPMHLPGVCPGGVGLDTALAVLRRGYVVVGSLPTTDGTPATAQAGCLLVLDDMGQVVSTIANNDINGPWDMTAYDAGTTAALFVSNVLNGTVAAGKVGTNQGTVVRLNLSLPQSGPPRVVSTTVIGSGFGERIDPAALIIGPTGLALGQNGALYVADTLENRIAAIPHAATHVSDAHTGNDFAAGGALNGPLGLAAMPNGDVLAVNANDGHMVRIRQDGLQRGAHLVERSGTPPGAGALFGLAVSLDHTGVYYVDDGTNSLMHLGLAFHGQAGVSEADQG
jgi:hypothetical protein